MVNIFHKRLVFNAEIFIDLRLPECLQLFLLHIVLFFELLLSLQEHRTDALPLKDTVEAQVLVAFIEAIKAVRIVLDQHVYDHRYLPKNVNVGKSPDEEIAKMRIKV